MCGRFILGLREAEALAGELGVPVESLCDQSVLVVDGVVILGPADELLYSATLGTFQVLDRQLGTPLLCELDRHT